MNKILRKFANDMIPGDLFHPGEHLKDEMKARGITQTELSDKLNVSKTEVNLMLNGHSNITPNLAMKLEEALGIEAQFWMNLQNKYDTDLLKKQ